MALQHPRPSSLHCRCRMAEDRPHATMPCPRSSGQAHGQQACPELRLTGKRTFCGRFNSTTRRPTLLGALLMLKHTSKDCHALPFRPKRLSEVVVCQQASQNAFWSVFRKGSLSHFFEWLKSMLREPKKNRLFCTSKTHFLRENDTHTRLKVVLQSALPSQKSSTIYSHTRTTRDTHTQS